MAAIAHVIDHARPRPGQNEWLRHALASVNFTTDELIARGLTVLDVSLDHARPLIVIANSPRCAVLNGVMFRRCVMPTVGHVRTYQTELNGCTVAWNVVGH